MILDRQHNLRRGQNGPRRYVIAAAAAIFTIASVLTVAPAAAQSVPASACPEMTDSVRRLYRALFLREPDANEAFSWITSYQNGEIDLPGIATNLARTSEFQQQWGIRTSGEFVDRIHLNTQGTAPPAENHRHWTRALNSGYSRGAMTVALTESEEFVRITNTATPLAGYLRWYPPGTHWYCGSGSRQFLSIKPLVGDVVFADRLVRNNGTTSASFNIATVENGFRNATLADGNLPPQATDYLWFGALTGDGFYGGALTIQAPETTRWAVVFYTSPIGRTRLGWQISP